MVFSIILDIVAGYDSYVDVYCPVLLLTCCDTCKTCVFYCWDRIYENANNSLTKYIKGIRKIAVKKMPQDAKLMIFLGEIHTSCSKYFLPQWTDCIWHS